MRKFCQLVVRLQAWWEGGGGEVAGEGTGPGAGGRGRGLYLAAAGCTCPGYERRVLVACLWRARKD